MWLDKKIYVFFDDSQQIQWRALLYTLTIDRATIYKTENIIDNASRKMKML